jgi:hypothetical protein
MGTEIEIRVTDDEGGRIADLPEARVERIAWRLNKLHTGEIALDPGSRNAGQIQLVKRHIQVWMNGQLEFWGVPREANGNSSQVTIGMEDYREILGYRNILETNLDFVNQDVLQIATDLIEYAQDPVQGLNADEGITVYPWAPSGNFQNKTYTSDRKGSILEAMYDFTTLEDGFDWDCEWLTKQIRFYHPKKGAVLGALALEYGRSIVDYTYNETAGKMATKVDATGGTAPLDVWQPYERTKNNYIHEDGAASLEYGVHIAVLPSGAKSDLPWLIARAEGAVTARKRPVKIPTAIMIPNKDQIVGQTASPVQVLGVLKVGDQHKVRIDHGMVQVADVQRVDTLEYRGPEDLLHATYTSVIPE